MFRSKSRKNESKNRNRLNVDAASTSRDGESVSPVFRDLSLSPIIRRSRSEQRSERLEMGLFRSKTRSRIGFALSEDHNQKRERSMTPPHDPVEIKKARSKKFLYFTKNQWVLCTWFMNESEQIIVTYLITEKSKEVSGKIIDVRDGAYKYALCGDSAMRVKGCRKTDVNFNKNTFVALKLQEQTSELSQYGKLFFQFLYEEDFLDFLQMWGKMFNRGRLPFKFDDLLSVSHYATVNQEVYMRQRNGHIHCPRSLFPAENGGLYGLVYLFDNKRDHWMLSTFRFTGKPKKGVDKTVLQIHFVHTPTCPKLGVRDFELKNYRVDDASIGKYKNRSKGEPNDTPVCCLSIMRTVFDYVGETKTRKKMLCVSKVPRGSKLWLQFEHAEDFFDFIKYWSDEFNGGKLPFESQPSKDNYERAKYHLGTYVDGLSPQHLAAPVENFPIVVWNYDEGRAEWVRSTVSREEHFVLTVRFVDRGTLDVEALYTRKYFVKDYHHDSGVCGKAATHWEVCNISIVKPSPLTKIDTLLVFPRRKPMPKMKGECSWNSDRQPKDGETENNDHLWLQFESDQDFELFVKFWAQQFNDNAIPFNKKTRSYPQYLKNCEEPQQEEESGNL